MTTILLALLCFLAGHTVGTGRERLRHLLPCAWCGAEGCALTRAEHEHDSSDLTGGGDE